MAAESPLPRVTPGTAPTARPILRLGPDLAIPSLLVPTPYATPAPAALTGNAAIGEDSALLDITAKPSAAVTIDGESRGQTPIRGLRLKPGSHSIVLIHADFQPFRRKLTIGSGQRRAVDVDLAWEGVRK
jgi:hypothetical protein